MAGVICIAVVIHTLCHFERSEKPAFPALPANSRFLVAALFGMTSFYVCV